MDRTVTRRFLGVFPPQCNFDKAHLKAYIKGNEKFRHGFEHGNAVWHEVKQQLIKK